LEKSRPGVRLLSILRKNMTLRQLSAVGVLTSMAFAVTAQQVSGQPDPLDANAAVPVTSYHSAYKDYRQLSGDEQPSADKVWRAANDEVAKSDGHAAAATNEAVAPPPPADAPPCDHSQHH
jgi:hypothetical protein